MNDYLQIRELYHWGIKGQKWGVRRYQNADGTLTEEGKKHYEQVHQDFYKNVMGTEESIATANLHNLSSGRQHNKDDSYSAAYRVKAVRLQKQGKKYLKELFDSGYYQQKYGFDPKTTSYESFMSTVEISAAKNFVQKNGRAPVISQHDSDGSEEYEQAIIDEVNRSR